MNNRTREIQRGDVFYADLSPVKGSEQDGTRPVLVIQNDVGNKYSTMAKLGSNANAMVLLAIPPISWMALSTKWYATSLTS